ASAVIAEGEVMQLMNVGDTNTTEDSYLKVIASKTAALFAAACEVGAVVAERPKAEAQALQSYGHNLGIAFQLVDDALDYSAEQEALGKTIGDDFREGKVTLPILLAFRRGNAEERAFWKQVVEEGKQEDGDLEQALEIIRKHTALDDTIERARHYGAMAKDALGIFEDSETKAALLEAVDFSIERAF
ncbi:polyprenyl synthetase family protein, partial [uncultured Sneathiella sp.]|uniref:polyprenyl synthetase family protein n=1 Tax=uncultured Sneathiella sp. TaxID=879315 RepID=UPI0030D9F2C3